MKYNLHMESVGKKILVGASTLSIATFITKILGAIYRIPLTNLLGAEGMGIYQLIFPLYCLILDFSGHGAPNAIARLIAKQKSNQIVSGYKIFRTAIKSFAFFGIGGFLFMALGSNLIASLQGNNLATFGYLVISPAIFAVSLISCFRGYFQGNLDMKPTAISQIIEQLLKMIIGIIAVYIFRKNLVLAIVSALFAITIAEFVALLYLYIRFRKSTLPFKQILSFEKSDYKQYNKELLKTAMPITLVGVFIPLSQFIDSFLIVNLIGKYSTQATSLYGLYSGSAMTVVHLPISLLHCFACVAVPWISSAQENNKEKRIAILLLFTLIFGIIFFFALSLTAPLVVELVFKGLSEREREITINLIKLLSANVVFLSLLQTENSILIGQGKLYSSLLGMVVGTVLKIVIEVVLITKPEVNIYGASLGLIACYFVASLVNLIIVKKGGTQLANKGNNPKELNY